MKRQKLWARFFLVASLATMVVIFCFSGQPADDSSAVSDEITLTVAGIVRPDYVSLPAPERQSFLEALSKIIRKNAHFLEYALLGFNLTAWLCLSRPQAAPRRCRMQAWGLTALYAASDELHQLFVEGRSAEVLDILIDSAGGLFGVLIATLALKLLARFLERRPS